MQYRACIECLKKREIVIQKEALLSKVVWSLISLHQCLGIGMYRYVLGIFNLHLFLPFAIKSLYNHILGGFIARVIQVLPHFNFDQLVKTSQNTR